MTEAEQKSIDNRRDTRESIEIAFEILEKVQRTIAHSPGRVQDRTEPWQETHDMEQTRALFDRVIFALQDRGKS